MTKMGGLAGKHILVTGAAGLIGSAVCKALAENGALLSLLDVSQEKSDALRPALGGQGRCWVIPPTDLLDSAAVDAMLTHCEQDSGPIDVLIHAAYPRTSDWHLRFEDIPTASWQRNVDMHLNGTFVLAQRLGQRMVARRRGNLLLFSSIYGLVGPTFGVYEGLSQMTMPAAYSAIKGGISNFVRYLAAYWGAQGIRVNAICPGGVLNEQAPAFIAAYSARVPMKRMASVEDIVGPVLFLASDASAYVTGVNLPVDGGWTAV